MTAIIIALSSLLVISLFSNWILLVLNYVMENDGGYESQSADLNRTEASSDNTITVAFHDDMAYWIDEQGLKTAPITEKGEVIQKEQRQVDTAGMSESEVNVILNVVDAIKKAE